MRLKFKLIILQRYLPSDGHSKNRNSAQARITGDRGDLKSEFPVCRANAKASRCTKEKLNPYSLTPHPYDVRSQNISSGQKTDSATPDPFLFMGG